MGQVGGAPFGAPLTMARVDVKHGRSLSRAPGVEASPSVMRPEIAREIITWHSGGWQG